MRLKVNIFFLKNTALTLEIALQGVFRIRRASLQAEALRQAKLKDIRSVVVIQRICRGWIMRYRRKKDNLLKKISLTRIRQIYRRRMRAALIITNFIREVSQLVQHKIASKQCYQNKRVHPILEKMKRMTFELDATYTRIQQDTFFERMYLNKIPSVKKRKLRPIKSQSVMPADTESRRFKSILSDQDGEMSPGIEKLKSSQNPNDIETRKEVTPVMAPAFTSSFMLPRDSLHRSRLIPIKHKFSIPQNRSFLTEKSVLSDDSSYMESVKSKIYLSPIDAMATRSVFKMNSVQVEDDAYDLTDDQNNDELSPSLLNRLRDIYSYSTVS